MFYLQPDDAVLVLTLEDGSISEDTCKAEHGCFFSTRIFEDADGLCRSEAAW